MVEDIIKSAGYKLTKPRLSVLGIFQAEHETLNAKEVYLKLKKRIDLVSVYRALALFKELGILHLERIDKLEYYYLAEKPHHHIVCSSCGYKECVPCDHIFSKIPNFSKISHQLSLSGVCKSCANN